MRAAARLRLVARAALRPGVRHAAARPASRLPADGKTLADFASTQPQPLSRSGDSNAAAAATAAAAADDPPPYVPAAQQLRKRVFMETYGCQMNVSDTEVAWAVLREAGCEQTTRLEEADVALLVTCAIRENAENRVWQRLEDLAALKRKRRGSRTSLQIGVLGCMAERLKEKLLERQRLVDVIAGPDAYRDLPRLLNDSTDGQTQVNVMLSRDETYAEIAPVRLNPGSPSAFVSIQRGCDNMCSYCIVPFTRGRERSRPLDTIVEEAKQLRAQGVREITLLGQNVNSYNDLAGLPPQPARQVDNVVATSVGFSTIYKPKRAGRGFAELLAGVAEAVPDVRVRFTSPHPKDFTDEVLHTMASFPNICKQLHLPAQSGSSSVLERMRRGHTREAYLQLVERVWRILPGATLSSDFIAGFCGETEEEHADSVSLIRSVEFDMAYLFAYSMRAKTHAHHRMVDDVSEADKKRRLQELIDMFHHGAARRNAARIGKEFVVMVDGPSKRSSDEVVGRTEGNTKIVFSKNVPGDAAEAEPLVAGDFVRVVAESGTSMSMRGKLVGRVTNGVVA